MIGKDPGLKPLLHYDVHNRRKSRKSSQAPRAPSPHHLRARRPAGADHGGDEGLPSLVSSEPISGTSKERNWDRCAAIADSRRKKAYMRTTYVETLGEIQPKFMIDLLADRIAPGQFKLALWDGEQVRVEPKFMMDFPKSGRRVYSPAKVDPTIARAIYFPTQPAPYGTIRELFEALFEIIKRFSGLPQTEARLLSYAILASWVVEFTEVPICLALVGSPSIERRQLMRLLRCLLRRALPLGEANLAALCSLPTEIGPTLLIERCEPSSQFLKFLEVTNSQDAQIVSRGRVLKASCAKVVCIEEPLGASLSGWLTIELPVTGRDGRLPVFDPDAQQRVADEFQPKFEMFRLRNYNLVNTSVFDVPEISSDARDLARCLGGVVAGDAEIQAELAGLLKEQDVLPVRTEHANELHSVVIEALLFCSHQSKNQNAGVAEITTTVNNILKRRGELLEMSPRGVGNILRALGFSTHRLSATRRGIILLNSVRQRIHRLASKHNLLGERYRSINCVQCDELLMDEVMIAEDHELAERISSAIEKGRETL